MNPRNTPEHAALAAAVEASDKAAAKPEPELELSFRDFTIPAANGSEEKPQVAKDLALPPIDASALDVVQVERPNPVDPKDDSAFAAATIADKYEGYTAPPPPVPPTPMAEKPIDDNLMIDSNALAPAKARAKGQSFWDRILGRQ